MTLKLTSIANAPTPPPGDGLGRKLAASDPRLGQMSPSRLSALRIHLQTAREFWNPFKPEASQSYTIAEPRTILWSPNQPKPSNIDTLPTITFSLERGYWGTGPMPHRAFYIVAEGYIIEAFWFDGKHQVHRLPADGQRWTGQPA